MLNAKCAQFLSKVPAKQRTKPLKHGHGYRVDAVPDIVVDRELSFSCKFRVKLIDSIRMRLVIFPRLHISGIMSF